MKTTTVLNIDQDGLVVALREVKQRLESTQGDAVLDFSSVRRIDSNAVRALEELSSVAEAKAIKVALRDVNVDVYKALKLVKLTRRFSFVTDGESHAESFSE